MDKDFPPTDEGVVSDAKRRTVTDHAEAFEKHKAAQQSGGPCKVCGWRDGDGVKTCFH